MRLPANAHDTLFAESALRLGQIHWLLLNAANRVDQLRTVPEVVDGLTFHRPQLTEFGKEVGQDEINWWIVKQESDLPQFLEKSQRALTAAETLKARSRDLRKERAESYEELITTLKAFVEACSEEIGVIHEYVDWLRDRDPLAPSILFTYRVAYRCD